MNYRHACSSIAIYYPKLLGSYEAELSEHLEQLFQNDYTAFVDIGCADGYFAVGFAVRNPDRIVYAFDVDAKARELCRNLANQNGVSDRVRVRSKCDGEILAGLDLGARALILSDCEGYELELFTDLIVDRLANHDFLIEVHDFINIDTRDTLAKRFHATHHLLVVDSVDDFKKTDLWSYPELEGTHAVSEETSSFRAASLSDAMADPSFKTAF